MTPNDGPRPPALRRLQALCDVAAAGVSIARARQLRWVVGELTLFHESRPASTLDELLSPDHLDAYLRAADEGLLRQRGPIGKPSPPGASRARRVCVGLLVSAHGRDPVPLSSAATSRPRTKVTRAAATRAIGVLLAEAREPRARANTVRAALVAVLVHDHDLRTGEIASLKTTDIVRDGRRATCTVRRSAPGAGPGELVEFDLSARATELLDLWLAHRARLVAPRDGRDAPRHADALLVSVRANHRDGVHLPAGSPLEERGLLRAHVLVISHLNDVLLASPSTTAERVALPRTLGELRPEPSETG